MTRKKRLGEILLEAGLITESQLAGALQSQKTWGGRLGSTLVRMGFVKEGDLLRCLSGQLRLPSVDFAKVQISPKALQTIPHRIAEKYNVVPVALKEELGKKTVILAMADPTNLEALSEIQFQTGVIVRPVVAAESSIARAVDQYYGKPKGRGPYGFEKNVELSASTPNAGMVILSGGDEKRFGEGDLAASTSPLESPHLVRALVRLLLEKGVISPRELDEAVRRSAP